MEITDEDIKWASRMLTRKYGDLGAEIAGEALFLSSLKFDPSRGVPFRVFARKHINFVALNFIRNQKGKRGSKRRLTKSQSIDASSSQYMVSSKDDDSIQRDDETRDILTRIDRLKTIDKAITLLRFCGLPQSDIQQSLGRSVIHVNSSEVYDIISK